ncbi:MAG: McrC family protein [Fibrobacteres bacterium]|nr:McrC family protein [Fibrobacterota bacterium]
MLAASRLRTYATWCSLPRASLTLQLSRHSLDNWPGAESLRSENLAALRGKLSFTDHLRHNLTRRDRFFAEFDEFTPDRPENRLLHAALRKTLEWTSMQEHQKRSRELCSLFSGIPVSGHYRLDLSRIRRDRGMEHYQEALDWARLILEEESPLTGAGDHNAPSLLFPMETLFEAFVAKHIGRKLGSPYQLKTQARSHHLVCHQKSAWFALKPDLLVLEGKQCRMVLDTKWKLLDGTKQNGTEKYGLSQSDFYQLQAYGLSYLEGIGDIVLVYPKTAAFQSPLPVFTFPQCEGLKLWVVPFCLDSKTLVPPANSSFSSILHPAHS